MIRRFLALLLISALVPLIVTDSAAAQGATVVFSEIHYHPQSVGEDFPDYDDREDTEFLELVNISAAPINVSNWCVRQAVDFCFPAGSTLNPQDPFVIARDAALFQGVYGVAPDATYTSRLSNSGEFIQLVDAAQSTVSQLIWDSTNPWPVTPDGNGPSLELVSSAGSVGSPANWAASSVTGGTPGSVPSLNGATPPLILSHTAPEPAVAGANVPLTAFSANATSVSVTYDINFGSNVTVPMTGNGGQWQVQLPALSTGDVMRFRFEATGPGGTTTSPRPDDSISWWATAVPTNPVSSVPTLDFHLSDADWSGIEARTCGCTAVIVHDGKVWTDVEMRRAGLTSIGQPKGSMRLDFPDGHPFEASWLVETSDELTLDMGYPNHDLIREQISWQMMDDLGFPPIQSQHVRVSRNGNFHGLYLLRDEQDGDWRSRNDLDRGALYKFDQFGGRDGWGGGFTKKEGLDESDADLAALLSCVNQTGAALRSCMLDTVDVPQMAHEIAAMTLIRQVDQREFNWFLWRDDTQGGLWRLLPEDLDRTWGIGGANIGNPTADSAQPYRRCIGTDGPPANEVCRAIMRVPEFETMVNRRLRTLTDENLNDPKWLTAIGSAGALIATDWDDDEQKWNRTSVTLATAVSELQSWVGNYVAHLRAGGHDGKVPAAQSNQPAITVTQLRTDVGDGFTYVLLTNPSNSESVDVSGWQFDGLATIADGTVILPGATVAVTNNDASFRLAEPGFTDVRARLDGTVAGATQLLRRDGSLVDTLGEAPPAQLILNEWNAVSGSNVLPGGDPTFGVVAGNGGDWFELVVLEDNLDLRGWRLVIADADGAVPGVRDDFEFANRIELSDLEAGLIITVSEDRPDDLAYAPVDGDWHINLQANEFDDGAFFTPASQGNFDTNHENWQLTIYDDQNALVFGPVGEGIGALSGINNEEVGELETTPSRTVDRLADYGDGNASTYGLPNETAGVLQDFTGVQYPYLRGDVNCDGTSDIVDALLIAQLSVGNRTDEARCPLSDVVTRANSRVGDINRNGQVNIVDALIISQCAVGIDNGGWC